MEIERNAASRSVLSLKRHWTISSSRSESFSESASNRHSSVVKTSFRTAARESVGPGVLFVAATCLTRRRYRPGIEWPLWQHGGERPPCRLLPYESYVERRGLSGESSVTRCHLSAYGPGDCWGRFGGNAPAGGSSGPERAPVRAAQVDVDCDVIGWGELVEDIRPGSITSATDPPPLLRLRHARHAL